MPSSLGIVPARLRQIAFVAADLTKAQNQLTHILGTEVIYVDPQVSQWGLENALLAIGGDIIEIVSPIKPGTTAGRLLEKRGDGGYMVIMQTVDAVARRSSVEENDLAKVIFSHETDEAVCIQYHPKGIKGGMMPEMDSHHPSDTNSDPLGSRFSPWHACGPDYTAYSEGMKRHAYLQLRSITCRLAPGDVDTEYAAKQWEKLFGVRVEGSELFFTNAKLRFVPGVEGQIEGLESVTILVDGEERFNGILERARQAGVYGDGWINMIGVKWYFVLSNSQSKL